MVIKVNGIKNEAHHFSNWDWAANVLTVNTLWMVFYFFSLANRHWSFKVYQRSERSDVNSKKSLTVGGKIFQLLYFRLILNPLLLPGVEAHACTEAFMRPEQENHYKLQGLGYIVNANPISHKAKGLTVEAPVTVSWESVTWFLPPFHISKYISTGPSWIIKKTGPQWKYVEYV